MENLTPTPTRSSIPSDFSNKTHPNHPSVFQRLRIRDVSDAFVEGCLADFERVNGGWIDELVELELRSSMGVNGDRPRGRNNEMGMRGPLVGRSIL